MPKNKLRPGFSNDKYLISEQPAMTVVLTGIIAAFFIGFSLKALFNPVRLTAKVAQAAGRVHRDVSISFDSARMSLADGLFPDLAVVITNVRLSSEKVCWGRPEIFIDEIRMPLSPISWFRARVPVRRVDIHEMVLNIRSEIAKCEGQVRLESNVTVVKPIENENPLSSNSVVKELTESPSQLKKNPIDKLNIYSLRVNYIPEPRYKAKFDSIRIRAKGQAPRSLTLDAKTHLFKDEGFGDFLSYANIHLEYSEHPEELLIVHFFGNLREGYYSLIGNYSFADHLVNIETELKHIPLTSIIGLASRVTGDDWKINPKKLWLSLKANTSGASEDLKKSPIKIRDVRIEGETLEIKTDSLEFLTIEPLVYKPIKLSIKNLGLLEAFSIFETKKLSKALGNLGSFSGFAEIKNATDIHLAGDIKGLELNFSNRGDRAVQVIEKMNGDIRFLNDSWQLKLDHIVPKNGVLSGEVDVVADKEFRKVQLNTKVEEVIFSEEVQKLMTSGGHVDPMRASISAEMNSGIIQKLNGFVKVGGFLIDGIDVGKADLKLSYEKEHIVINTNVSKVKISNQTTADEFINHAIPIEWKTKSGYEFSNISGKFEVHNSKEMTWHNVVSLVEKNKKVVLDGGWNKDGVVFGQMLLRDGGDLTRYRILGTREEPIIRAEK